MTESKAVYNFQSQLAIGEKGEVLLDRHLYALPSQAEELRKILFPYTGERK
jgi:hypothetical protein